MLKKIAAATLLFLTSVVYVYSASSSPAGSATPCPPQALLMEVPFVIYFETYQDSPMVTQTILKDFPDALIEISCTTVGNKALAKIYVPAAQRGEFSAYLSSTSTAVAGEFSSKRMKVVHDKKDADYRRVMGEN